MKCKMYKILVGIATAHFVTTLLIRVSYAYKYAGLLS